MKNKSWTTGLSPEEAKELNYKLKNSGTVLSRLSSILDQRLKNSADTQLSQSNYNSPSWALQQADSIGYQRAMKEVMTFLQEK